MLPIMRLARYTVRTEAISAIKGTAGLHIQPQSVPQLQIPPQKLASPIFMERY